MPVALLSPLVSVQLCESSSKTWISSNSTFLTKHVFAQQHCQSWVVCPLGLAFGGVEAHPSPQLSLPCHLFAPVKLPQFLSVQCRPAHFLIERCSEVQERRGAQCTSVFGLAQKCFFWLNPLVLRSSYNKLKGPNCPQGKGLATIDMWWDKSPVLIPNNPPPIPDRRDEHVSSVCFALWAARPQVQRCKTLYIQHIDPVRRSVWLGRDLECLQFTANPIFPVSLHILFKVKGHTECVYQIFLLTALTVGCCLSANLERWEMGIQVTRWREMNKELKLHYAVGYKSV